MQKWKLFANILFSFCSAFDHSGWYQAIVANYSYMREWWINEYEGGMWTTIYKISPKKYYSAIINKVTPIWLFGNLEMFTFCNIAVFRSKAIFSHICMPCDIKHRLQTTGNDLFLLIVRRDLFRREILAFLSGGEGGHLWSIYEACMKFCSLLWGIFLGEGF